MKLKLYEIEFDDNTKLITKNISEIVGEYNNRYNTDYNIHNIRYGLQTNNLKHIINVNVDNLYDKLKPVYHKYLEQSGRKVNTDRTKNRIYEYLYNEYVCSLI